jgi:26S proteasome regulatory subunit N10
MRNGDFSPSRFEAQQDACVSICGTKVRQHPENSVGLISSAGRAVEVCSPLTQDPGKVIAAFHKVKLSGESNFVSSIRVAQLALRHRQKTGKTQEQRIILFVGSPISSTKQELEDIGKQLRKFSIAIDIISFGVPNVQLNEEKLEALFNAANNKDETGKDNSHLVPLPSGNLTDVLSQLTGEQPGSAAAMELDPELAWAVHLSKQSYEQENKAASGTGGTSTTTTTTTQPDVTMQDTENFEDDPEFLEAIRLSLAGDTAVATTAPTTSTQTETQTQQEPKPAQEQTSEPKPAATTEKEAQPSTATPSQSSDASPMDLDIGNIDPSLLESIVLNLPNVDKNDPELQKFLQGFKDNDKDKEKK